MGIEMTKNKNHSKVGDFSNVSLSDAKLPDWIEEGALASGGYPYDKKMNNKDYIDQLNKLNIELVKFQRHVVDAGLRVVILFEGRDTAGKGGTIKRFTEHLNPRVARIVALPKPTETERGQWYFQRYIRHLPTKGNIVFFDRSWYNRAGVEKVFGFCTAAEHQKFLRETPDFEKMLLHEGIILFKFWLTIGREMQLKRLHDRQHDPLKQWKLSSIDLKAISLWDEYTRAREEMFQFTHELDTPWWVIKANDKRRARLEAIRKVLSTLSYAGKNAKAIGDSDEAIVGNEPDFLYSA